MLTRVLFFGLVVLFGCASAPTSLNEEIALNVIVTADFHGAIERAEKYAETIHRLREQAPEKTIHLDGGDLFQGSLEDSISKGQAVVDLMNAVKLDAAAVGNHELDYGSSHPTRIHLRRGEDPIGNLRQRARNANFAWLSSNFIKKNNRGQTERCNPARDLSCNALSQKTLMPSRTILNRGDLKICVVGATTPITNNITPHEFLTRGDFAPLKEILTAEADFSRNTLHCNATFLVAHAGLECNTEHCHVRGSISEILYLLEEMPFNSFDGVIAGHTHQTAQEVINGTPVVEGGSHGRFAGVMSLTPNRSGQGPRFTHRFSAFEIVDDVTPSRTIGDSISSLLKKYRDKVAELKARIVGHATAPFSREYLYENPASNFAVDALRDSSERIGRVDFAILNAGGVRGVGLPNTTITFADIFNIMPFPNNLALVTMTGTQLHSWMALLTSGAHGAPPISNFRINRLRIGPQVRGPFDRDLNSDGRFEDWERDLISEMRDRNGNRIEPDREYVVATSDFLLQGGDHLSYVQPPISPRKTRILRDVLIRDLILDYLQRHPLIRPEDYFDPQNPRMLLVDP